MTLSREEQEAFNQNQEWWHNRLEQEVSNLISAIERDRRLKQLYKETEQRVTQTLNNIASKINSNNYTITDFYNYNRMSKFKTEVNKILKNLATNTVKITKSHITDGFLQGRNLFRVNFAKVNKAVINKLIDRPWTGNTFSERIWHNTQRLANVLNNTLKKGIIDGISIPKISRNLATQMGNSYKRALTLIRTETIHFFNKGSKERYKEMGTKKVQLLTTNDSRRCSICAEFHMKTYKIDEAPIIPLHPNGRCTLIPVIEDEPVEPKKEPKKKQSKPEQEIFDTPKRKTKAEVETEAIKKLDINSYTDRRKLAKDLLSAVGLEDIPISIRKLDGANGQCSIKFARGKDFDTQIISEYALYKQDPRSQIYQTKTALHELYHAKGSGRRTDYTKSQSTWSHVEETFAEASAHYLAKVTGVSTDIAPAYADKLIDSLPRLKKLDKYKNCNTIADFGKIAWEDRLNGGNAEWLGTYNELKSVEHNIYAYAKENYYDYIKANKELLVDKHLENTPNNKQYREYILEDLNDALLDIKNDMPLYGNEKHVFNNILAISMNKIGVK